LLNFVCKQTFAAAAVTAGILPQARWRRVPNKKRIGQRYCAHGPFVNIAVTLTIFLADDNKNKVNKRSIFSNSFCSLNLTLDSVQKLVFRLSFLLSL